MAAAGALVTPGGHLNADNWFGDRNHRNKNGYTDLAETFAAHRVDDGHGRRHIPLKKLSEEERAGAGTSMVGDPSLDLRIVDARNIERFASGHFDRVHVDYRPVHISDGGKKSLGKNIILGQELVLRTTAGELRGSVDQWFVLDIPTDYNTDGQASKSKARGTAAK